MEKIGIGIAGTGGIANGLYLPGIADIPRAEAIALCDIDPEKLAATQERFGVTQVYSCVDDMLAQAECDIVLNTTPIQAHCRVSLKALEAGVNVYTEKTIATSVEEADHLIKTAERQGVMLACAPDSMVWPVQARLKELVDSEVIGRPLWARVRGSHGGPGAFHHPNPVWFYQPGAGPLPDMGVYGLDLVTGLLGPARRVTSLSAITRPTRYVRRGPLKGMEIPVNVEDNVLILLEFDDGVLASADAGYCLLSSKAPDLEIFGTDGTLALTGFLSSGPETIHLYRDDAQHDVRGWVTLEEQLPEPTTKALGLSHAVDCLLDTTDLVLTPQHARHVLEIMVKALESSRTGQTQDLTTAF
jgi:predicted dehydrogenase